MGLSKYCKISYLLLINLFALPSVALAQDVSIRGIFEKGTDIVGSVIQFLWVLAFAVFIWGVVKFIAAAGNSEKRKTAKDLIIYGLVGLFVMLSFMGIIYILQNTIFEGGVPQQYTPPSAPTIP